MNIQELWSQGDERHLLDFGRDLATDDLPGALFALGGASDEERQVGRAQIEAWGRRLSAQAPSGDAEAKALALGHVLATELGFKVDERPSPVGVKLQDVLVRRKGHPALLAALYREVAAAAGIPAEVVSLPGRVLVRIGQESPAFADPTTGQVLGEADVQAMLTELMGPAFDQAHLAGSSVAEVVATPLQYLMSHHAARGNLVELYRELGFAAALRPEQPMARLQQAAVAERLGAREQAVDAYRTVAHDFPNTQESVIAAHKLRTAHPPAFLQ